MKGKEMPDIPKGESAASKSPSAKTKSKTKKLTPKELLQKENRELKQTIDGLQQENQTLKGKLDAIISKIVSNADECDDYEEAETEPCDIPLEEVIGMLSQLITKSIIRKKNTLESRVEELETRLTAQSTELVKVTRAKNAYEYGLDAVMSCPDMEQATAKIEQVKLEVDGPQWTAPVYSLTASCSHPMSYKSLTASMKGGQQMPFNPPRPKHPGDTHINQLIKELRLFLVRELSMEKSSRADWRTFGERVGIPLDVIEDWEEQHFEFPMSKVFSEWSQSESATVRMLHRHLVSPQMRCILLAKRLADYYQVL